ncbi:MAG: hypothetical protein LBE27_04825 [Deltaproteobacteria bacterium]|jgi:hypothetical protein|nr:hypothetical protein [Deltaproteobacteria bacterium]
MEKPDSLRVEKLSDSSSPKDTTQIMVKWNRGDFQNKSVLELERSFLDKVTSLFEYYMKDVLESKDVSQRSLVIDGVTYKNCGVGKKLYQGLMAPIQVERHTYKNDKNQDVICPMEINSGILLGATPFLAKILSSKIASMNVEDLSSDLKDTLGRELPTKYIEEVASEVGSLLLRHIYRFGSHIPPHLTDKDVSLIVIELDSTFVREIPDNSRRERTAFISLIGPNDECHHRLNLGGLEMHDKKSFFKELDPLWKEIKKKFPHAKTEGLGDGAPENWKWLDANTDLQLLDFQHLLRYIYLAAYIVFGEAAMPDREKFIFDYALAARKKDYGIQKLIEYLQNLLDIDADDLDLPMIERLVRFLTKNLKRTRYRYAVKHGYKANDDLISTENSLLDAMRKRYFTEGFFERVQESYGPGQLGLQVVNTLRAIMHQGGVWESFWEYYWPETDIKNTNSPKK